MARGKHAVQTARQQIEAAEKHIDRLTDEIVRLKLIAQQHSTAAARLPEVQARCVELERQVAEHDTPLSQKNYALVEELREAETRVKRIARLLIHSERNGGGIRLSMEEQMELALLLGFKDFAGWNAKIEGAHMSTTPRNGYEAMLGTRPLEKAKQAVHELSADAAQEIESLYEN